MPETLQHTYSTSSATLHMRVAEQTPIISETYAVCTTHKRRMYHIRTPFVKYTYGVCFVPHIHNVAQKTLYINNKNYKQPARTRPDRLS